MSRTVATAAEVRAWLVAHPKTLGGLSEAAQRTVVRPEGEALRGRLSPEAYNAFNKGQRKATYAPGNTRSLAVEAAKAAKAARKAAQRKASRKGAVVGTRGPLPKAFAVVPKG